MEPESWAGRVHTVHRVHAASILIVGGVVAVDPAGLWPFGPLRWLVVSTVGVVVSGLCLRRFSVRVDRRTFWLWVLLVTCLAAAALSNGDLWVALIGTDTRHFGLITWLLCFGLFCAGQQLRGHERNLLRAGMVAVLFTGVWCVWEALFGPPIALGSNTSRLTGPFGSAALLGSALCLFLPMAVAVVADGDATRRWRLAGAIATMSGTFAILGSGSRAAWLGFLIAAVLVAWKRPAIRRPLAVASGGLVLVMLLALPLVDNVLERSHGATSRLDEWRVATRVLADHPLVGVGPEGYRIAVSEGIDAEYERAYPRDNVLPDRAHSSVLDVALAGGIVAAAAFLALLMVVGRRAMARVADHSITHLAMAASFVAYFSAQLLLFPVFELDPIAWLIAGAIVAGTAPVRARRESFVWLGTTAAAGVALVALVAGVLDVAANRLARDAMDASARDADAAAQEFAQRATRLRPDSIAYEMVATQVLLAADTLAATERALVHAETALDWSRHDPIAVDLWASSLLQRATQTGNDSDARVALSAWELLVERDPNRRRWQLQFGRAAALAGDVETARVAWQRAAALGSAQAEQLLEALP